MNVDELKKLMNDYANVEHHKELLKSQKEELRNKIIPTNIQVELESLNEEFKGKEDSLEEEEKLKRKILDNAIKEYLKSVDLINKTQIKTELLTVTLDRGDVIYDPVFLDGFAINHPEILSARTEKDPKVRITKNKL